MITIYTKDNCMQCEFVKKHLREKGKNFWVKDVNANSLYMQEVKDMGYQTVPVTLIERNGEKIAINGFRPDELDEVLEG
ncbi:glutaredoxin family protein [Atopobacter phocae]|uniref:glutaredoxin family protein n=1 Tax=Atopobacter phocae TaxID=136492 RepID=UPI00047233FB|nr:glutaredoxin family protein [Atopobacter phocae]